MTKQVPHGYYTHDEKGLFHSFNDEPAVVIENYQEEREDGEIIEVEGYKAWFEHGEQIKSIRNNEQDGN